MKRKELRKNHREDMGTEQAIAKSLREQEGVKGSCEAPCCCLLSYPSG